jgi:hypothetical protein
MMSGEEVICEVVEQNELELVVKTPLIMVMVGEGKMGMAPWLPLAETTEFAVNRDHVVLTYVPKVDLMNHYKQNTGGIVLPPPGVLNQLPPNFGR